MHRALLQDLQLGVCLRVSGFSTKKQQQQKGTNVSASAWQTTCAKLVSKKRNPYGSETAVSVSMGKKRNPELVVESRNCCSVKTGNDVGQTQDNCCI